MPELELGSLYRSMGKSKIAAWALRQQRAEDELSKAVARYGLPSDGGPVATFNRMHWISWSMGASAPAADVRNENRD